MNLLENRNKNRPIDHASKINSNWNSIRMKKKPFNL